MGLIDKLKSLFQKKEAPKPEPVMIPEKPARLKKACKECGKMFSYDPNWDHIPNYCKECKQKFAKEREEKQRAGTPRKIKRTCKQCGKVFTFPNTLEHYPNYCSNCRKQHQAAMKEKYSRKKA
ncbi:MAG: hypothetical protein IJ153_06465 [Clostridia bacterium]|nr:hypothetical protein [Clostridia bacterium]